MASFEDRKLLQKEDFQLINKIGLKFSGPNSWPLFRSYRPGYHPWYLTNEEARYLTLCLWAECMSEFQGQFLKLAENYKSLPQEILVNKEETFKLLEPITSELGIKLRRVKKLKMLEDARASMFEFTAGENRDVI